MNCTDGANSPEAKVELFDFPVHGDARGFLIALECLKEIPFDVKRVYFIYDTKEGVARGFHAHRKLKQVLIAVSGSMTIHVEYGDEKKQILLDSPDKGLLIDGLVWREMHDFSNGAVLLVLANEHYIEKDYIRDYDQFKIENQQRQQGIQ